MTHIERLLDLSRDPRFAKQLREFLREDPDVGELQERLADFIEAYHEDATDSDPFIAFLFDNIDNRGIMADLRSGMSRTRRYNADPILARFSRVGDDHRAKALRYVGAWFATYPSKKTDKGDVGTLCRSLVGRDEAEALDTTGEPGPLTKRFLHLLQADGDEVYARLSSFVLRAKSESSDRKPINYAQWLKDMKRWHRYTDQVKEQWSASYWNVDFSAAQTTPSDADSVVAAS
jgi:hypothetical protein